LCAAALAACTKASAPDDARPLAEAPSPVASPSPAPAQPVLATPSAPADGSAAAHDGGAAAPEQRCVVFLHGKSGTGFPTERGASYLRVGPTGNADGWGGRQWLYFPEAKLAELRTLVGDAIAREGCTEVILHGFSNGGAAVAKLYCTGERFGGRVIGYVMDDPVPDHAADGCAPAAGTQAKLYWTTALTPAPGWSCSEQDWTCEGGSTVGIQKFAANLGLSVTPSVHTRHEPTLDPPEYRSWW
jgi:hypothetical protein